MAENDFSRANCISICCAASVCLIWKERAPPLAGVGIGMAVLIIGDARIRYSLSGTQVDVLGVAMGEIPGVRLLMLRCSCPRPEWGSHKTAQGNALGVYVNQENPDTQSLA
jgi:hypothetical protein